MYHASFLVQSFIFLKVCLAVILGGCIGWERETMGKPAGLRTHMLVAGASAMMAGLADILIGRQMALHGVTFTGDPTRIIQAITVGVSFIGAGTIIHDAKGGRVSYLTTAASILFVSAIGIAAAFDQFFLGTASTVLVMGINRLQRFFPRSGRRGKEAGSPPPQDI